MLGNKLTDYLIDKSAGEFFITGTSISELISKAEKSFKEHNIGSIADYSLEGLEVYD